MRTTHKKEELQYQTQTISEFLMDFSSSVHVPMFAHNAYNQFDSIMGHTTSIVHINLCADAVQTFSNASRV